MSKIEQNQEIAAAKAGMDTKAVVGRFEADLFDLVRGDVRLTRAPSDITFYKSTGSAIFDLAAAALVAKASGIAA